MWRVPACIMANVIVLIVLIGATKAFFVSDVSGSWIFCVERAIELTLFTAYLFASLLLDGTFPCAFKMCQGERRGVRATQQWATGPYSTRIVGIDHSEPGETAPRPGYQHEML